MGFVVELVLAVAIVRGRGEEEEDDDDDDSSGDGGGGGERARISAALTRSDSLILSLRRAFSRTRFKFIEGCLREDCCRSSR
mmetsp:Transcript_9210/g.15231  ORF Transcript_9210/g.15231 Transcript_9210/m.15231 type:complete len:82 (-) Transcript_9210:134-379(-)